MQGIKLLNRKIVIRLLGQLLLLMSLFLLIPLTTSLIYGESDTLSFIYTFLITSASGGLALLFTRKADKTFGKREGYLIVSSVWIVFSLFGSLPYVLSNSIPDFAGAFFETMSGFTTTGASVLNNIEEMPHGILLWRSMSQWMGGMGIIVLFV